MPESESPLNPYAPSAIAEDSSEDLRRARGLDGAGENREDFDAAATASLGRTVVRWLLVCTLSAIPSFVFGMLVTEGQIAGMATGILMFVAGYTWLDFSTVNRPWRRNRRMRRTLRITYGTRIVISILFPIGAYLDVMCGIVSVSLTAPITGLQVGQQPIGFSGTLLTTLAQGGVLNVVLGIYALLVHAVQLAIAAMRGGGKHRETSSP